MRTKIKTVRKSPAKPVVKKAKYEYWKSPFSGEWFFRLLSPNGEIIAQSEGYKTRVGVKRGIAANKKHAAVAEAVEVPGSTPV